MFTFLVPLRVKKPFSVPTLTFGIYQEYTLFLTLLGTSHLIEALLALL